MKRLLSAVLASCLVFSLAACAKTEPTVPATVTTEAATTQTSEETTTEATTTSEETTTEATTTTAEPTTETTAAPVKNFALKSVYTKMNSLIGKDLETVKKAMEAYLGVTLELTKGGTVNGQTSYDCQVDLTIDGVHFNSFGVGVSTKKQQVRFIAFSDNQQDLKTMKSNYSAYTKKLKKAFGKPVSKTSQKTLAYQIFKKKKNKKVEYNTGYLNSTEAKSFWFNVANYSIK